LSIDNSLLTLSYAEYIPEQDEKITFLYQFINKLNKLDKALILLYLDDNSYDEIAEILGITKTNVATKISRIKKALKEKISNY
jgi:RNA polymerase sigma-70 factor (ECF subfamily)